MRAMPTKEQSDKPKKRGRPAVGVTNDNAVPYWKIVNNWVVDHKLERWVKDGQHWSEAKIALETMSVADENLAEKLNKWCKEWLSKNGWCRLQANARQSGYVHGRNTKTGDSQSRPRKKNLQLEEDIYARLKVYAKSHNLTINNALRKLMDEDVKRKRTA